MIYAQIMCLWIGVLVSVACAIQAYTAHSFPCPPGLFKCRASHHCISKSFLCDRDFDCPDHSDETDCEHKPCSKSEFSCREKGACIRKTWVCDGVKDCENNADESVGQCGVPVCSSGMFRCLSGQCISANLECNGDIDCLDESDEKHCQVRVCTDTEFACDNGTRCINAGWRCDGDYDCNDYTDETTGCIHFNPVIGDLCSRGEFQCVSSGDCIKNTWKCDGEKDCVDGSDEKYCHYRCADEEFMCTNKVCIPNTRRCDHTNDCTDTSDELNCPLNRNCSHKGEFDCYGDGTQCLPMIRVCDHVRHCKHGEDEDRNMCPGRNPCKFHNCPPNSHCVKDVKVLDWRKYKKLIPTCKCDHGFKYDQGHCVDIDECKDSGPCSQVCINTHGSYTCKCESGYTLEKGYLCKANDNRPALYYTNHRGLHKMSTESHTTEMVSGVTEGIDAFDIDMDNNVLFWVDRNAKCIKRADLTTLSNIKTVVAHVAGDRFSVGGIAVDWINERIFWTVTEGNKIMVASYDGSKVMTSLDNLHAPLAIVVDPEFGYVYWSNGNNGANIERCGMDGRGRDIIVKASDRISWPNGLTIDYTSRRLFWIDAKLHKIGSINMDGSDFKFIYEDATVLEKPRALTVFEDYLYWTEWVSKSIRSVHKMNGYGARIHHVGTFPAMDIKIYQKLRQNISLKPAAMEFCRSQNCAFMCVPTARENNTSPGTFVCECADGAILNHDNRTCGNHKPHTKHEDSSEQLSAGLKALFVILGVLAIPGIVSLIYFCVWPWCKARRQKRYSQCEDEL